MFLVDSLMARWGDGLFLTQWRFLRGIRVSGKLARPPDRDRHSTGHNRYRLLLFGLRGSSRVTHTGVDGLIVIFPSPLHNKVISTGSQSLPGKCRWFGGESGRCESDTDLIIIIVITFMSETGMTASVLKQDPNTDGSKECYLLRQKHNLPVFGVNFYVHSACPGF